MSFPPTPPMDNAYYSHGPIIPTNSSGQVDLRGSPYTPPEDRGATFHNPSTEMNLILNILALSIRVNKGCGTNTHNRIVRNPAARGKVVKQSKEAKPVSKSRKKRAQKHKEPEILPPNFKPLSVLARSYPDFDDGLTEAKVRRGKEVREHENVTQGRVKRPLNCFILYRSHFNNVTKQELKKAAKKAAKATPGEKSKDGEPHIRAINPRVSEYVARSWRNETEAIRARFDALALEDAAEHLLADPDYKYTPKPKKDKKGKKRKARSSDKGRAKRRKNSPDSDDEDDADFSDGDTEVITPLHRTPQTIHSDSRKSPLPEVTGQEWVAAEQDWVAVEQGSSPYPDPRYQDYHQPLPAYHQQPRAYQQQQPAFHYQHMGQELPACSQQSQGFYQSPNHREPPLGTVDPRLCQRPGTEDPHLGLPSSTPYTSTQFSPLYVGDNEIETSVGQFGIPYDKEMDNMLNLSPS
uniref:HMG box domain-containing protein n=1 Tax=Bionectria ochroleuca TaxID=29856 RepID=A0A0B7KKX5_BIOOC